MTGKRRKGNEIADTKWFDQEQTRSFGDGKGQPARSTKSSSVVYRLVGEENNDLEERTSTRGICSEER